MMRSLASGLDTPFNYATTIFQQRIRNVLAISGLQLFIYFFEMGKKTIGVLTGLTSTNGRDSRAVGTLREISLAL